MDWFNNGKEKVNDEYASCKCDDKESSHKVLRSHDFGFKQKIIEDKNRNGIPDIFEKNSRLATGTGKLKLNAKLPRIKENKLNIKKWI